MHLRHAKLFCEVVSRGSISAAAEACAIAQPTASQAVSQIEEQLGVQLLDRSSRPVAITPAGKLYAAGCHELLQQVAELEDRVRAVGNTLAGQVRIAAIYSVSLLEIRTLIEAFETKHPEVHLEIEYCHPSDVYDRLRTNRADLGLIAFPRETGEFVSLEWQRQPMAAVMAPTHELASRRSLRFDDLNGQPFVALTKGLKTRQHLDRVLRGHGVAVREVGQFDNFDTLRRAVVDGGGLSIAPTVIYERDIASGLMRVVPIEDDNEELVRPLGVVHLKTHHLSAAASAFVEELIATASPGMRAKPRAEPAGVPAAGNEEAVLSGSARAG